MGETVLLEEQKGLWIEERLLREAELKGRLQVIVEKGEIRILPAAIEAPRLPYGVGEEEAQRVLREVREEVIALYGGQAPPDEQPYFGGLTWQEYRALSDEQRRALWDRVYAEFDAALPYVVQEVDYVALREMIEQVFVAEYGAEVIRDVRVAHFNPNLIDVTVMVTSRDPAMDDLALQLSEMLRQQGVRVAIRISTDGDAD